MDYFALNAETVIDNGYRSVVAVLPEKKQPRHGSWQTGCFKPTDPKFLSWQIKNHPDDSLGIACGLDVLAVDIDAKDPVRAYEMEQAAIRRFGETPLRRVGQWPKRLLVYRSTEKIDTQRTRDVEVLGRGSQFVGFGVHPATKRPYYWIDGSPTDTDVSSLPLVTQAQIIEFLNEVGGSMMAPANDNERSPAKVRRPPALAAEQSKLRKEVVYDPTGRVTDGRESYLTLLVYKYFMCGIVSVEPLAAAAWQEFYATTDLTRPAKDGRQNWSIRHARVKARACIRKHKNGKPVKRARRADPIPHLHSHRRPDYWTPERKKAHQTEATSRTVTASALAVNQGMLDMMDASAGQCVATVRALAERTGLKEVTVKKARSALLDAGLWVAERAVYVPLRIKEPKTEQAVESAEQSSLGVYASVSLLSRSIQEPEETRPHPVPANDDTDARTSEAMTPDQRQLAS